VDVGRVDARWRLDGDLFAMTWPDCSGPPVSPPERQGFGRTVIESMVKQTVDGDLQLDYAPSKLVWRLACPAVSVLERKNPEPSTPARSCFNAQPRSSAFGGTDCALMARSG